MEKILGTQFVRLFAPAPSGDSSVEDAAKDVASEVEDAWNEAVDYANDHWEEIWSGTCLSDGDCNSWMSYCHKGGDGEN